MTPKHQPETELPWEINSPALARVLAFKGISVKDADYIVHACNSYPKLLEALKGALTVVREAATGEVARGINAMDGYACNKEQKIVFLLRELREGE